MTIIEELKERAKCRDCLRVEYCKRIPVNDNIVKEIKEDGKCLDFVSNVVLKGRGSSDKEIKENGDIGMTEDEYYLKHGRYKIAWKNRPNQDKITDFSEYR